MKTTYETFVYVVICGEVRIGDNPKSDHLQLQITIGAWLVVAGEFCQFCLFHFIQSKLKP